MGAGPYKIKISAERTLGPLDFERVRALVQKGRIQGEEPTAVEPFAHWKPFSSYPELGELILKKLEADKEKLAAKRPAENALPPGTLTNLSAAPTRTILHQEVPTAQDGDNAEKSASVEFEMPTLLDIKKVEKENDGGNPDTEKTRVDFSPRFSKEEDSGATKILSVEKRVEVLKEYPPLPGASAISRGEPAPESEERGPAPGTKRRLLSRNTAAILAIFLLVIAYFSSENQKDPDELVPRHHTFPYTNVNPPPPLGVKDKAASSSLAEAARTVMAQELPSDYIRAIRSLYLAVGKDPENYVARGLLASSYMRIAEIIPRNEDLNETLKKLLFPAPPSARNSAEYSAALAEYYLLLQRFDQAEEAIENYIHIRPTAELYYQKAVIESEKKNLDAATTYASKTIPPEGVTANPRHLLFYAKLLDKKGQKSAVQDLLQRLRKEHPWYGPGIFFDAELKFRAANYLGAKSSLVLLVNNPALVNRLALADVFVLVAKTFDALHDFPRALRFLEAARDIHPGVESNDDLFYKIKSQMPATKKTYGLILQARQNEKAKQFDDAINYYLRARETDRNDPIPDILIGRLYLQRGQIFDAIDYYTKALHGTKPPVAAPLELADIYINRYEMDKAQLQLAVANQMRSHPDAVQMLQAKIQLREGQKDLAKALFRKSLSGGSRIPETYLQLGHLEEEKNNRELAEFYYAMALRYDPLNGNALLGLAFARFYLESPTRAISFLKEKLNEQPNSAPIMTSLAVIYLSSGDQDSGKNYLENAIKMDQNYAMAFKLLGDLTRDEGMHQTDPAAVKKSLRYALASYEIYSKKAPNDPEGYKAVGDLYFQVHDLGAAAKNYHQVLSLAPNYPNINLRLGMISENGGDAKEAENFISKELQANPRSDAAYVELGNIHTIRKEYPEAINNYRKASVLNDQNVGAIMGMGKVYLLQDAWDDALSLFQRVIKIDPLYADAYWEMGLIYERQNNRQRAVQAFTNFLGLTQDRNLQAAAHRKIRELSN